MLSSGTLVIVVVSSRTEPDEDLVVVVLLALDVVEINKEYFGEVGRQLMVS